MDGYRVSPAKAPPEGRVALIAAQPVDASAAQLMAAIDAGREFCIHTGLSPDAGPDGGAFVQCETSGSSGQPKRIRRSHASWIRSFELDRGLWNMAQGDHVAVFGALSHSLALYGAVCAMHIGADLSVIAAPRPDVRLRQMDAAAPTHLFTTPTQLRQLATARDGVTPISALRHVLVGGGFLDGAAKEAAQALFPNAAIHGFYGASETSFITFSDAGTPPLSVGRPYPGVTLRIRDGNGNDLPSDEVGEIWVRSPFLFEGYALGNSMETRWQDGFLTVGELGWRDAEGFLYHAGRRNRMFTVSDRNVFPEAMERILLDQPGVAHAAVLPVPDPRRGSVPVCFLSGPSSLLDPGAVLRACRQRLGAELAPRRATLLEDWPTLPSGKTDLAALERLLQGAS